LGEEGGGVENVKMMSDCDFFANNGLGERPHSLGPIPLLQSLPVLNIIERQAAVVAKSQRGDQDRFARVG
jgi:hypothetical protein